MQSIYIQYNSLGYACHSEAICWRQGAYTDRATETETHRWLCVCVYTCVVCVCVCEVGGHEGKKVQGWVNGRYVCVCVCM